MIKATFTGDIMSSLIQNEAIKNIYGIYDYSTVFYHIRDALLSTDFLCGNLETPLGYNNYTNSFSSFNTPLEFARSLHECGFDLLTTANNHAMDRGKEGLMTTIDILDHIGIDHTGTYKSIKESDEIYIKDIDGCKIAVLSFTYGTNSEYHQNLLTDGECYLIDLLKKQALPVSDSPKTIVQKIKDCIKKCMPNYIYKLYLKARIGEDKYVGQLDNVNKCEINNSQNQMYLQRCLNKVSNAKELADIVIVCCHAGGQYNSDIGDYTKYIFDKIAESGADVIVGNHPHCILQSEYDKKNECMKFYSLGNFAFTPGYGFYVDGVCSEFSILLNIYIEPENKKIEKFGFSILHVSTDKDNIARTRMFYDEYKTEINEHTRSEMLKMNSRILNRFLKNRENETTLQPEYQINSYEHD